MSCTTSNHILCIHEIMNGRDVDILYEYHKPSISIGIEIERLKCNYCDIISINTHSYIHANG